MSRIPLMHLSIDASPDVLIVHHDFRFPYPGNVDVSEDLHKMTATDLPRDWETVLVFVGPTPPSREKVRLRSKLPQSSPTAEVLSRSPCGRSTFPYQSVGGVRST